MRATKVNQRNATQAEAVSLGLLFAAMFTVALGYGAILPTLPFMLERLLDGASSARVASHTGLISGTYMFAIFVFAPLWGRISDRAGRKTVLLTGLGGYVVTLVAFGLAESLWALYAARALAGAFVSAVLPVSSAYVSQTGSEEQRARRLAGLGAASLLGFLMGPAVSGWAFDVAKAVQTGINPHTLSMVPLYVTAALGVPVWLRMFFSLEEVSLGRTQPRKGAAAPKNATGKSLLGLLGANLLVTYALGSFEVSIALQGRQTLGLDPYRVGIMFMECSLIMVAIQALIFCFPVLKRLSGTLVLVFGFLAMTAGFLLLPIVTAYNAMLLMVALVAGGSGILLPFLTYRISFSAPLGLGTTLGLQTAAASLGQGIGSAAGGWLFGLWNNSSFFMTAAVSLLGALLALFAGNTLFKDSAK